MILTDRSRILSYQRCPRRRYLEYHMLGKGIQRVQKSLPLVFGSAFHEGCEAMLRGDVEGAVLRSQLFLSNIFEQHGVSFDREEIADEKKAMLYGAEEQGAMAEALLRGFWAYEGETLLEGFEVLEVEREGRAILSERVLSVPGNGTVTVDPELILMFRPDALVREKSTGDLYVISWKTCSTFGQWTLRGCRTDMQSMSEVWGVEQTPLYNSKYDDFDFPYGKVEGVLYKFAVKGQRMKDNWDGLYKQSTHLIYGWKKLAQDAEDNWSWAYSWKDGEINPKTGKEVGHTLGKGWQKVPIWREYPGGVKAWIEGLSKNEIFPRTSNALSLAFPAALPISRRADEIERWKRQIVSQELKVARDVEFVGTNADQDDLDELFPQHTHACEDFGGCPMWDACWVPSVGADPVGSGLYQIRTISNHPEGRNDDE